MYKVKLNNRTIPKKTFETYEQARSAVRSMIRKKEKDTPQVVKDVLGWNEWSRNPPNISFFGYQIVRASGASANASAVGLTD